MNLVEIVTIYITHAIDIDMEPQAADYVEKAVSLCTSWGDDNGEGVVYSESEWASEAETHELKRSGHLSLFANQSVRAVEQKRAG